MGPSKAEPELSTSNLVSGFVEFIQPPICWVKFTKEENLSIKKRCKEIYGKSQTATISNTLAGNISRQHKASDDLYGFFLKKCTGIADEILSSFPRKREWRMTNCWVNYQKKHEFNPLHHHSGVFSFVYWVHIPYEIEEEMQLDFVKRSNNPAASAFSIVYTDLLGNICQKNFPVSKNDEGLLLMFPSRLNHLVYPFYTSDELRISISGNLTFEFEGMPDYVPDIF